MKVKKVECINTFLKCIPRTQSPLPAFFFFFFPTCKKKACSGDWARGYTTTQMAITVHVYALQAKRLHPLMYIYLPSVDCYSTKKTSTSFFFTFPQPFQVQSSLQFRLQLSLRRSRRPLQEEAQSDVVRLFLLNLIL